MATVGTDMELNDLLDFSIMFPHQMANGKNRGSNLTGGQFGEETLFSLCTLIAVSHPCASGVSLWRLASRCFSEVGSKPPGPALGTSDLELKYELSERNDVRASLKNLTEMALLCVFRGMMLGSCLREERLRSVPAPA
ncbi:hypothetical protein DNTS_001746 [Danionella cerebrum]|uniref:Uncharacterized protein n=1 Tax=Danionella cerebrum TaxID=2873325 RepID=A0A553MRV6_9TELE|nr:hypothetical protein DNTS_001746 [Danionella translucida]